MDLKCVMDNLHFNLEYNGGLKMGKSSDDTTMEIIRTVTSGVRSMSSGINKTLNDKTGVTMTTIILSGVLAALVYKRTTLK